MVKARCRRWMGGLVVALALLAVVAGPSAPAVRAAPRLSGALCQGANLVVTYDGAHAGEAYRLVGSGPGLPGAAQTTVGPVVSWSLPGPGTWTDVRVESGYYFPCGDTWVWSPTGFAEPGPITCGGEAGGAGGPGPEMITLPTEAAVGRFVADTLAYWAPDPAVLTEIVFEAGKTVWVLGMDADAAYYHVYFAGSYLWVPVESMGPNPDAVWQNRPLPGPYAR